MLTSNVLLGLRLKRAIKVSNFYLTEEWSILILLGLGGSAGFPPFPFDEVSSELESSWFPAWLRLTVEEMYISKQQYLLILIADIKWNLNTNWESSLHSSSSQDWWNIVTRRSQFILMIDFILRTNRWSHQTTCSAVGARVTAPASTSSCYTSVRFRITL